MTLTGLALKNLGRNKFRVILTALGVAIAIVAFLLLRTVIWAWASAAEWAAKDRIVTRHKVTFVMNLPRRYVQDVGAAPHRVKHRADQGGIRRDQRAYVHDAGVPVPAERTKLPGEHGAVVGHRGEGHAHLIRGGPGRRAVGAPWRLAVGSTACVAEIDLADADSLGYRLSPVAAGTGHRPPRAASRRAARMSAVEAAPGSSWPTLRGPR